MPIPQHHGVELFLPPFVYVSGWVVLSEGKAPSVRRFEVRDIFYGGIEHQVTILAVEGEIIGEILPRDPMRYEWTVRKGPIGERHCNIWHIGPIDTLSCRNICLNSITQHRLR